MFFKKKETLPNPNPDISTPQGFEQLYHAHIKEIYMLCYQQLRDKEAAQEIAHDIFRSIWERRHHLNITVPISHYLRRATKLKIIDHLRQKERETRHLECALINYCASENFTQNQVEVNELERQVNSLVDSLPCRCREVFQLSRQKGMSNKEIASALLISENTVKVHLNKALNHLKVHLTEYKIVTIIIFSLFISSLI